MSALPTFDDPSAQSARQHAADWLRARLYTEAGTPPPLESRQWLQLPDGHPLKVSAVCKAALAWLRHCDPEQIKDDLLDELEATAWARRQHLADEATRSDAILSVRPTREELQLRRQITSPAAVRPWTDEQVGRKRG